jgi:hypothetical protein
VKLFSRFRNKHIPLIVRLGIMFLLLIALPIFIWAVMTQRIELRKYATTAEPTIVCWNRVIEYNNRFQWPNGCKGDPNTNNNCTQVLVPLNTEEIARYNEWVLLGRPYIPGCGPQMSTPTPTPPTQFNINWTTPYAYLHAGDMTITANGKIFKGKSDPGTTISVGSDPGNPNYTTLEVIWKEHNVEMRMFAYFNAETITSGGTTYRRWWVNEIRTYNGNAQGDWIYYHRDQLSSVGVMGIGVPFVSSNLVFTSNDGGVGEIQFSNLWMRAFINENQTPTPTAYYPTITPTGIPLCHLIEPLVNVTPLVQNGHPGESRTYSVSVTNQDTGSPCPESGFSLWAQVSSGWTYGYSPINFSLLPGQTKTTILTVTPSTTPVTQEVSAPVSIYAKNDYSSLQTRKDVAFVLSPQTPQTIDFRVKLAGVSAGQAEGAEISVKFMKKDGTILQLSEPLTLTYVSGGVYKATAILSNPFPSGTEFTIKIKGEKHVAIKFCRQVGQTAPCGDTEYIVVPSPIPLSYGFDLTGIPLPPGDLPPQDGSVTQANITLQDGTIVKSDFNRLIEIRNKFSSDQTQEDKYSADLNYDGTVNSFDLFLILQTLMTRHDE